MAQSDWDAVERHLLASVLIGAAILSGSHGADDLARLALLITLLLVSVAAIAAFAEVRSGQGDDRLLQPLLSTAIVVLVLLSCVLRSSALGAVPQLAVSSLDVALVLYAFKAAAALAPSLRRLRLGWPAKP